MIVTLALIFCTLGGCAGAPRKRFLIGAGIGGGAGAIGGTALSPNDESRGLNALVFGLTGAIVGGLGFLLFHDDAEVPDPKTVHKVPALIAPEYVVSGAEKPLPEFVQKRLKPIVVEEITEPDTISEDGSLHEPHKVYRIKQQAELIAKPILNKEEVK